MTQGLPRGSLQGLHENAMLVALIEATAEQAANRASKEAVTDTFRLLGIDIHNELELRATREFIGLGRDQWHAKRDARSALRHTIIEKTLTIILSLAVSVIGVKLVNPS
jgi:hypothetical protein